MAAVELSKPISAIPLWLGRPISWAVAFGLADAMWIALIYALSSVLQTEGTFTHSVARAVLQALIGTWNSLHTPIRTVVEPLLFAVVEAHPENPGDGTFIAYYALCIVQSVIIGYIIGLLVRACRSSSRNG